MTKPTRGDDVETNSQVDSDLLAVFERNSGKTVVVRRDRKHGLIVSTVEPEKDDAK